LLFAALPAETFVGLATTCLVAASCYLVMKKPFENIGAELNALYQRRQSILIQSIGLIKETRVMGKENHFLDRFINVQQQNFSRNAHYIFLTSIPPLMVESIVILATLGTVGYVLFHGDGGVAALAILGLLAAALFRSAPILNRIVTALQQMNMSRNSVEILANDLAVLSHVIDNHDENVDMLPFREKMTFDRVCYAYPSNKEPVLRDIQLEIFKNEFIGITGPSGSGKSTLAALMLGLVPPSSGRMLVDGVVLDDRKVRRRWQKNLAFVAQSAILTEDTIAANVAFGIKNEDIDREKIWNILEIVQLKEFIQQLPGQLDYFVGEQGIRFSGGQRQRLSIARALYHDVNILLLDEATSALDLLTERAFSAALGKLRNTHTVVLIAHRLDTLRICDRVVMLSGGRIIDSAPFDILQERCTEFRKLVELSKAERPS